MTTHPPVSPGTATARFKRWLHEPLLHFVLIGVVFYAAYSAFSPAADSAAEDHKRIVLTADDLVQMTLTWRAQGRPMPTPQQLNSLIETKVREEVLYREALALGLDKDDTIVKRRLAQKMDFVAEDLSTLKEPTPQELKAWFDGNRQRFAMAPRLSFHHLYYSPDKRQDRARADAERALANLSTQPPSTARADAFMFKDRYVDQSTDQLAALFGPRFAQSLAELPSGAWHGPVESGYGWHLVFVEEMTPGRVPAFEEIEADVRREWVAVQRAQAKRKMYDNLRARYEVVVLDTRTAATAASTDKSKRP